MKSRWSDNESAQFRGLLGQRVYTSRLLGGEASLVLHGGGNTSVKIRAKNFFGAEEDVLYVKGSGHDLATISEKGFSPVKMEILLKLAEMAEVSDSQMVSVQRTAMTDPFAPDPSIEAVVHAILPFTFVDHTHADAVVTISNSKNGEKNLRELFGKDFLFVPYVKPGFILAKKIQEVIKGVDLRHYHGLILLHHGVFTFDETARGAYEKMITMVNKAEEYLQSKAALKLSGQGLVPEPLQLAAIRKHVSGQTGGAVHAILNTSGEAITFSQMENLDRIAGQGPLTPDHIIRTKRVPAILKKDALADLQCYETEYNKYFNRHKTPGLTSLDPAPRWALWEERGSISFGRKYADAKVVSDIIHQTIPSILKAESLGGWQALPEKDLFEIEYWELEQAKLKNRPAALPFTGKIVLITGAATGIGAACVREYISQGASVAALDIDPKLVGTFQRKEVLEIVCDVTKKDQLQNAIEQTVLTFGGIDVLVSNAGVFTSGKSLEEMGDDLWRKSMSLNLDAHLWLLRAAIPYLKLGIEPAVVVVGSKNVPAPGPGASAYSVAKAALTQMARVAALELGEYGIRVNTVHPNAVFDTGVWTEKVLQERAANYKMTVEEYKRNNILHTEINSTHVASMIVAMSGPVFQKTTGAQVPVDGGNERVI